MRPDFLSKSFQHLVTDKCRYHGEDKTYISPRLYPALLAGAGFILFEIHSDQPSVNSQCSHNKGRRIH